MGEEEKLKVEEEQRRLECQRKEEAREQQRLQGVAAREAEERAAEAERQRQEAEKARVKKERSSSSKPCCVAVQTQSRKRRASQQCRWLNVATRRARTISWLQHSGVAWPRATAEHRSFPSSLPALIIVFVTVFRLLFVGVAGESLYFLVQVGFRNLRSLLRNVADAI